MRANGLSCWQFRAVEVQRDATSVWLYAPLVALEESLRRAAA
jgi:hypothetical protein